MLIIPTTAQPTQTLTVQLANQACTITIGQKSTGLFLDLYVNSALVIGGVICQDRNRIVRDAYLGFVGDLMFFDTQGTLNPYFSGLGDRWLLAGLDAADLS